MPSYTKAYRLADLQRYAGWHASAAAKPALQPDSIVYMREDRAVVTDCFDAETVLFESTDPEWERFCCEELGFEVPDWEAESLRIRARLALPRPS